MKERGRRMERYVEMLESELGEQDRLRQEVLQTREEQQSATAAFAQARQEQQAASAAFARGVRASEATTLQRSARHVEAEAVAAAQARLSEEAAVQATRAGTCR